MLFDSLSRDLNFVVIQSGSLVRILTDFFGRMLLTLLDTRSVKYNSLSLHVGKSVKNN